MSLLTSVSIDDDRPLPRLNLSGDFDRRLPSEPFCETTRAKTKMTQSNLILSLVPHKLKCAFKIEIMHVKQDCKNHKFLK